MINTYTTIIKYKITDMELRSRTNQSLSEALKFAREYLKSTKYYVIMFQNI